MTWHQRKTTSAHVAGYVERLLTWRAGTVKCDRITMLQAEGYDKGLEQRVNNLEAIVSQLQK